MTIPARASEDAIEMGEEQRVVHRKRQWDMSHVAWAVDRVKSTRPTEVLFVARTHGWVIEPPYVRVKKTIEGVGVRNPLTTDAFNFFPGVSEEPRGA